MDTSQMKSTNRNPKCWYHEVCDLDRDCEVCIKYIEMSYLMENSNLPKAKQRVITLTAPECDKGAYRRLADIKSDIYDFVKSGKSLYLGSIYSGNGKTSWAIKMMHKYFEEVWNGNGLRERAVFIHVPTFLMKCKDFGNKDAEFQHLKSLLTTIDLVVWDDIASTEMTAYDYSQLLPYIDSRSLGELSNIYTGNFDNKDDLASKLGERLASRIWSSNTEIIIFNSGDIR